MFVMTPEQVRDQIRQSMKSTGSIFYWIAGCSVVNTLLLLTRSGVLLLGGLGFTFLVDVALEGAGPQIRPIGFGIDLTIALMFVALGMWAGRGSKVAFFLGMGLYALDAGILVLIQDWLNVAFHGWWLFCLWQGLQRNVELQRALVQVEAVAGRNS
jgi:hypothetical protein